MNIMHTHRLFVFGSMSPHVTRGRGLARGRADRYFSFLFSSRVPYVSRIRFIYYPLLFSLSFLIYKSK